MRSPKEERYARDGAWLVREVVPRRGKPYRRHCSREGLETVVWHIVQHPNRGITTGQLWEALPELPKTEVSTALAFLKDRDLLEMVGRESFLRTDCLYEDTMVEYHVLGEPRWASTSTTVCSTNQPGTQLS
jgi:hypothetical protein